jgi:hypothetical protein
VEALEGAAAAAGPAEAGRSPGGRRVEPSLEPNPGAGVAETVVGAPLFRVPEDVVGLLDFLEPLLCGLVPRVDVGVELTR